MSDKREGNEFPCVSCVFRWFQRNLSEVLCKCSGKYIDIYFILKITFLITKS